MSDGNTKKLIGSAVRRHGWRTYGRQTDPTAMPEQMVDHVTMGLRKEEMNCEGMRLRTKWAAEECQREAVLFSSALRF